MAAIARGLVDATRDTPEHITEIHIFVDNLAAANAIFSTQKGPSQLLSVKACLTARQFLEARPENTIHVHWCPSHVGIKANDTVDRLAKRGLDQPQPEGISYAVARTRVTKRAYTKWLQAMESPRYQGRHFWPIHNHEYVRHTAKANWFLRQYGARGCDWERGKHPPEEDNPKERAAELWRESQLACRETARLCRFWTGHFPHGEFRERFNLPGRRECWCGERLETRQHILTECPLWIRPAKWRVLSNAQRLAEAHQLAAGVLPFDPSDEAEMRLEIDKIRPEEIVEFLAINPMVACFEWYDLLDKADECARNGNDHSLAHAYVEAHAARRKQLHREWTDLPRDTPGWRPWAELWDVQFIAEGIFEAWRNPPGSEEDSDDEGVNSEYEQVPV